jgi:hypothetical protein
VAGDVVLQVAGPDGAARQRVVADGRPFRLELALEVPTGPVTLTLTTDRTWSPGGGDNRQLGVQIRRVSVAGAEAGPA